MSNWTHVAALFRIDGCWDDKEKPDFDKIFGKECIWNEIEDKKFFDEFRLAKRHPGKYLPLGSEGSLHKTVWENPDRMMAARYTVSVWGDLRDHESIEEIENWFRGCCTKIGVDLRQAVCTINNEANGNKTIAFRCGEEVTP